MSALAAPQTGCSPTSSPAPDAATWVFWIAVSIAIGSSVGCGTDKLGPANLSSLPVRGLYVQFERRGWPAEYSPGQVIQNFDQFDAVVGSTVAAEVALQLDTMREIGVNTITYELRTADPVYIPGGEGFPTCNIQPVLGLQWPEPTSTELKNLVALFDLAHAKGMRILLRLTNTHMEEQPPTNSATWLGAILGAVKLHPALELVLFEGNTHFVEWRRDGGRVWSPRRAAALVGADLGARAVRPVGDWLCSLAQRSCSEAVC